MTPDELKNLWSDPKHWTPPGIYRCRTDPRVIVPKRKPWIGWTINFAHTAAWPVLFLTVLISVVPTCLLLAFGKATPLRVALALVGGVAILVAGSAWESTRNRRE